jgi:MYXO-CTERM domain-containing protein
MHVIRRAVIPIALVASLLVTAAPALGQCKSASWPFEIPPPSLHDGLEPFPLTSDRTSFYDGYTVLNSDTPVWNDIAHASGVLFAGTPYGGHVYDVSTDPRRRDPLQIAVIEGWPANIAGNPTGTRVTLPAFFAPNEIDSVYKAVDLKLFNGQIYYAIGGAVGIVLAQSNPGGVPSILYQEFHDQPGGGSDRHYSQVSLAVVGSRLYAFAATFVGSGVRVFDVTKATTAGCLLEEIGGVSCGGNSPAQGLMVTKPGASSRHKGVRVVDDPDGAGSGKAYMTVTWGTAGGVGLFELDLAGDTVVATSRGELAPGANTNDATLWRTGSVIGAALRTQGTSPFLAVYDLSSCLSDSCQGQNPSWQVDPNNKSSSRRIIASQAGGRDYLWTGEASRCVGPAPKEFIWDVTNFQQGASGVVDLTPSATASITGPDDLGNDFTKTLDYFRFYYPDSPGGSARQLPRAGVFAQGDDGPYLFRAMNSSVDTHRLTTGLGGAGGAAGYAGTAGAAGSAGTEGSGGAENGGSGAGGGHADPASTDEGGCGCRAVGDGGVPPNAWLGAALGAWLFARKRRNVQGEGVNARP